MTDLTRARMLIGRVKGKNRWRSTARSEGDELEGWKGADWKVEGCELEEGKEVDWKVGRSPIGSSPIGRVQGSELEGSG